MIREVIAVGHDVDSAIEKGCAELGVAREDASAEVLERAKKGLFGKLKSEAKVRVYLEIEDPIAENDKLCLAKDYLMSILPQLGVTNANLVIEEQDGAAVITIEGDHLGTIIGRRGETLDALQYLASLVCNRAKGDFYKITLDCCGYREKREETLKELAQKIAKQVMKSGRSSVLEPMNPYERRIIHAVISEIEGVSSKSVGEDPNRKVVVMSDNPRRGGGRSNDRGGRGGRGGRYNDRNRGGERRRYDTPRAEVSEETSEPAERISDAEYLKTLGTEELYSKIEL